MRPILLALASLAMASCATLRPTAEPQRAAVAVVFDRETITPVIVEGLADRATGRAVEANDPVRIASISKLVMALATLRLVDEGKVDLGTDVSTYLGWSLRNPAYPDVPVTLGQLLRHRSGLRDDAGYVIPLGESLQAKLSDPEAWYAGAPPGDAPFEYANLGSPVVATVLEAASGERYDRLVERAVFGPLGIKACLNWIGCSQDQADRAVVLYRSTGEVARDDAADRPLNCTLPVAEDVACSLDDYVPGTNASIFSPQGGVRIGMIDLAKIGQAILGEDNRLLSPQGFRQLKRRFPPVEGSAPNFCFYGFGVHTLYPGLVGCNDVLFQLGARWYGHAGEAYGLRSGLWMEEDERSGIAYFVTAVPDRNAPDEGGFAPEEIELVGRAMRMVE
ncbi:beta-lactamase family protein [Qipengyuania sp. 6B39]|uniref:serine hydrolase domain-containing protein n=1 Tax=Qipengyuania proteolytica TaxID=2867239 RepID=UPI001C8A6DA1|nr:serine hydrolase [Qipengyuania proteolytica]MBX7496962.1 beta-lactamase family protein [Qipengyuania proteolytica]